MTHDHHPLSDEMAALREEARTGCATFQPEHAALLEGYRQDVQRGLSSALERFRTDVRALSGGSPVCEDLTAQITDYVDWLQWTLWDVPCFAVALRPAREHLQYASASCALTYLSLRLMDDLMDRHFFYRGRRATVLATLSERRGDGHATEGLTYLAGMMLCIEGLSRLSEGAQGASASPLPRAVAGRMLQEVLGSLRRVLVGATMEQGRREEWNRDAYDRIVQLKNVDYWRILYAAIDPEHGSPLYPFLEGHYTLAQKLNDVQDHPEDEARGQPNLVTLHLAHADGPSERPASRFPPGLAEELASDFRALAARARALPATERQIAWLKLSEHLEQCYQSGVFPSPAPPAPAPLEAPAVPAVPDVRLNCASSLEEVVGGLGPGALEQVPCPVCAGTRERTLLHAQGFRLARCEECTHAYVNPRLRPELQSALSDSTGALEDPFLVVQKLYAPALCRLLRARARGERLLDIGPGRGYLLEHARAQGFQVYGVDSSAALIRHLQPSLGRRLHRADTREGPLPWGSFDVVVLSHVLEHLPRPGDLLARIRDSLNPGGLLYVAVPDMESAQFRVLGAFWDAISPLAHYHYFSESSLSRLLGDQGFEVVERIEPPPFPEGWIPRWMRLFRKLGGNESGELALLVRVAGAGPEPHGGEGGAPPGAAR